MCTPENTLILLPKAQNKWEELPPITAAERNDALSQAWSEYGRQRVHIDVTLSNRFVRYALTAAPGRILSPDQEEALAAAQICNIYGGSAHDWAVSLHPQPPGAGLVAAAVESALHNTFTRLQASLEKATFAVQPALSKALQQLPADARRSGRSAKWFVLTEPGWLSLLFLSETGLWKFIDNQPCDDHWPQQLEQHLKRAQAICGAPEAHYPVWLQTIGAAPLVPPTLPAGWTAFPISPPERKSYAWTDF